MVINDYYTKAVEQTLSAEDVPGLLSLTHNAARYKVKPVCKNYLSQCMSRQVTTKRLIAVLNYVASLYYNNNPDDAFMLLTCLSYPLHIEGLTEEEYNQLRLSIVLMFEDSNELISPFWRV